MAPDAQGQDLLYVSDVGTRDVKVYSYPGGQLKGTLTGFTEPWGVCADTAGDVFVTDLKGFRIFEFRHGAKKPAAILRDPGQEPGGCAVDPATGNLAVANVSTPYTGPGDLLVFLHARGKPKKYHDTTIHYYQFCGYDGNGNLFVDGVKLGKFQLAELLKGHSSLIDIALDKTYSFAGGVQWDGTSLAIGDYEQNVIDRYQIFGSSGKRIGETKLKGAKFPIGIWIQGSTVIAANDDGGNVMYWNYPGGGPHRKTIGGLHYPLSAAVSIASR
jgi:DNA-binding beta-propeller fold protein YncE